MNLREHRIANDPLHAVDKAPAKVAAVTLGFWIAKVAATTLGETGGDFLDKPTSQGGLDLSRFYAALTLLVALVLCVAMFPQRAARAQDTA